MVVLNIMGGPVPRESNLTSTEKASIQIEKFIFHIIIASEDAPRYLDMVELEDNQRVFFTARISEAAEGSQFVFQDAAAGATAVACSSIIENDDENFVAASRTLAANFISMHRGTMNNGVLVVALISIVRPDGQRVRLISLIKMDHTRVLQYTIENTENGQVAKMNEVLNSFVEDKKAMQKVALIDVGDNYAWHVLARDRSKPDGLTDFFKAFLGVVQRNDPSTLTRKTIKTVSEWAFALQAIDIPEDEEASNYKTRAISYMETHAQFDTDAFLDMVVRDEVPFRKQQMEQSLHDALAIAGIAGQQFSSRPGSIASSVRKNKRRTAEGVLVEWSGEAANAGVQISNEPDENGHYEIKIRTSRIVDRS